MQNALWNCTGKVTKLQKLLDICAAYANEYAITYNEIKTKCICFKPKCHGKLYIPEVCLNGKKLSFVESIKYLGVYLHCDFTYDDDMDRHRKYLYSKGNFIIKNFKMVWIRLSCWQNMWNRHKPVCVM